MLKCISLFALALAASTSAIACFAQASDSTPAAATAKTSVPSLVRFSGIVPAESGKLEPGELTTTFLIYKDKQGGEPLWAESQVVSLDAARHYEVHLGATSPDGLPTDLFSTGEARWLEVQVAGHKPEPRTLLVSVPYAMKSADAETLGGLPASAFMLAGTKASETPSAIVSPAASAAAVTTTGGTAGYLPVYSGATAVDDSILFQSGAKLGIGTNLPAATLDVNGSVAARGAVVLEGTGAASTAIGRNSQPLDFAASVYNSATKTVVAPTFSLQAEPFANNSATPSATLNLLYGSGATPTETGLSISSKGLIKFAAGQTFSGAGTITGVTTTSPLAGSGTTGSVALSLNLTALESTLNAKYPQLAVANKFTAPVAFGAPVTFAATQTFPGTGKGTITGVTTTSPLTGSGTAGSVVLGLNLTALETTLNAKYPQLAVASKFTAPVVFSVPVTFAATQTFPGIAGGGTITGVTTTSPLTGSGTKGSIALGLNVSALETTLNASYARLGVPNKFTAPVTFATGQTFPGAGTITAVTAGTGLIGGGTSGSIKLSLDPAAIPTLSGSPVFSSSKDGVQGVTAGTILDTAGVEGVAGTASGAATGIAGVWGDAYAHVGVLGTSHQYSGVQGVSTTSYGVQGSSTSNTGVLGTSNSGTGVSGLSTTSSGVAGYTPGSTINTAGVNGKAGTTSGILQVVAGVWGDSYQQVGVEGTSAQSIGVYGQSTGYNGVQGVSSTAIGVSGLSTSGTGMAGSSNTGAGMVGYTAGSALNTGGVIGIAGPRTTFAGISGVWGDAANHVGVFGSSNIYAGVQGSSLSAPGVQGNSSSGNGVHGVSTSTSGIFGETSSTSGGDAALYGLSHNNAIGVFGFSPKFGVIGESAGNSGTGAMASTFVNGPAAVWGDTSTAGYAVAGTTDNGIAGEFMNNSSSQSALYAVNNSGFAGSHVADFSGTSGGCSFFGNGDVLCTGKVSSAAISKDGEKAVKTYSVQSAENWYEDAGSGQLLNGVVHIHLDPAFAETVNTDVAYHVFLTPGGDSEGLYVTNKTADGFDVHEQHGGHSNIPFDYRILAKRAGHEKERLEDVTELVKKGAQMRAKMVAESTANSRDKGTGKKE
jgi:hypothetical protein